MTFVTQFEEFEADLPALRALDAIARVGSISAAAQVLGVTQQAVSARLRTFERRSRVELLIRTPRGAELTEAGRLVLEWADELFAATDRFAAGLRSLTEVREERLSVAASQTIAGHLLPDWIVRLRAAEQADRRVATSLSLTTGNSAEVIRAVESGRCDLGFIETPDQPRSLGASIVGVDELALVVAPSHPWAGASEIPLAEAAATPIVAREPGSGTRLAWERIVQDRTGADAVAPALELATNAAVRSSIGAGIAPGVLSLLAVSDDLALGRLVRVRVAGRPLTRELTALWRGGARDLGPAARRLLAAAVEERRAARSASREGEG